jgi:hypothetical protein
MKIVSFPVHYYYFLFIYITGRWILDFGKAFSGVVRFERGLPQPLRPVNGTLPQGHTANTTYPGYDHYITVIHAETMEMETGNLNTALVAGKSNV